MGNLNHEPTKLELPKSLRTDESTGCPACVCPVLSCPVQASPVQSSPVVRLWWDVIVLNAAIVAVPQVLGCQLTPSEPSSSRNCWHTSATWFHPPKEVDVITIPVWLLHRQTLDLAVCSRCLLTFKTMQNYLKSISLSLWRCSQHKHMKGKLRWSRESLLIL